MLVKHQMYVAEKTQHDYMQDVRRACNRPSLPERFAGMIFGALRAALHDIDFNDSPQTINPAQTNREESLQR